MRLTFLSSGNAAAVKRLVQQDLVSRTEKMARFPIMKTSPPLGYFHQDGTLGADTD